MFKYKFNFSNISFYLSFYFLYIFQIFCLYKHDFSFKEFIFIFIFNLFLLLNSFFDLKDKNIPLWTLIFGIISAILWHFFSLELPFKLFFNTNHSITESILGLIIGFIIFDILSNITNKKNKTGLIQITIASFILLFMSLLTYLKDYKFIFLYLTIILYLIIRKAFILIYERLNAFLIYPCFFLIFIFSCFKLGVYAIYITGICFLIEETIFPIIYKIFPNKNKFTEEIKEENKDFIGGADSMFLAGIGSFLGATAITNTLFFSALILFIYFIFNRIFRKNLPKEAIALIPFLSLGAQLTAIFMFFN